jgi:hypothetical protein
MVEELTLFEAGKEIQSWQKIAKEVIETCPKIKKEREKEILAARFGVGEKRKTLQAIGDQYGITRERVRQITNNAISKIKKSCTSKEIKRICHEVVATVRENGGYASNGFLAKKYCDGTESEKNAFIFIVSLAEGIENVKVSSDILEGWRLKERKLVDIKRVAGEAVKALKEKGEVLPIDELSRIINADQEITLAAVSASKKTMSSDDGLWGLTKWPHINPRSIRDKSKYIMLRHGKPIHYDVLAQKISELGSKNVTRQSVHNELIKNSDFVLVGRGIYALSEWGYAPGIVEEVIATVLIEAGEPLSKEIIVARVLERRIVKPSTIVLNLQRPRFKKVGKAVYTLN